MARLKIFSVYDSKIAAFGPPLCFGHVGQASRFFQEIVNDGRSQVSKYPADFVFYEIGVFDDEKGQFETVPHVNHGQGSLFVEAEPAGRPGQRNQAAQEPVALRSH